MRSAVSTTDDSAHTTKMKTARTGARAPRRVAAGRFRKARRSERAEKMANQQRRIPQFTDGKTNCWRSVCQVVPSPRPTCPLPPEQIFQKGNTPVKPRTCHRLVGCPVEVKGSGSFHDEEHHETGSPAEEIAVGDDTSSDDVAVALKTLSTRLFALSSPDV